MAPIRAGLEAIRGGKVRWRHGPLLLLLSSAFAWPVSAIEYGDFIVRERRLVFEQVASEGGRLGAPRLDSDGLRFPSSTLSAFCTRCPGGTSATETLTLELASYYGFSLRSLEIQFALDYAVSTGDGPGASGWDPFASVHTTAYVAVRVLETNLPDFDPPSAVGYYPFAFRNDPDDPNGPATTVTALGPNASSSGQLLAELLLDLELVALDVGVPGPGTRIALSITTTVQAFHGGVEGEALLSIRDLVLFTPWTSNGCLSSCDPDPPIPPGPPLPEPGTGLLVLGGLAGMSARRGR